ncbi:MAG: VCBS repeat-containing protein [Sphingobacteriales bacterium]|nr:VCBS repeat-containing protein [Sphingobacteriales bacterium]
MVLAMQNLNSADLDNDGYRDLLFVTDYGSVIIWYKNNGDGTFIPQPYIDIDLDFASSIYTADLNNDGNTDILWVTTNTVTWIPNNGDNTFGNVQIISNQAAHAAKVLAADVDNDGDIDVLSASIYSSSNPLTTANKIVWFSNNGNGTFAPEEVITTNVVTTTSITTADLDNDGDLDLASASSIDNKVAWYENLLSYLPPLSPTPPTAAFNTYPTTTDTLSICQGQTVYFNNTSQNATNYNWTFGDGTQSNDSNPAHTFNTSGNYEVDSSW